jgi:hypothetical protein
MTTFFGQAGWGGPSAPSRETQALSEIDSRKKTFVNKDFVKNIAWLNHSVDTLSAFTQKLQKGVDQANQNAIEQVQGFAADLLVLFAGLEPTGIELGDLKYVIQGIGALLGIDPSTPFPMNLIHAAENLFGQFIAPLPQFTDLIFEAMAAWAEDLGFSDEAVDSIIEFNDALINLSNSIDKWFGKIDEALTDLFAMLDFGSLFNSGPLKDLIDELQARLDQLISGPRDLLLAILSEIIVLVFNSLTWVVNTINPDTWCAAMGVGFLGPELAPKVSGSTVDWNVGSNPATTWVFDSAHSYIGTDGCFTTNGTGLTKRILSQAITPCNPGDTFAVSAWMQWVGIPDSVNTLGPCMVFFTGANEVGQTNVNLVAGHGSTGPSGELAWQQVVQTIVVPNNVDGFKIGARVSSAVNTGTVRIDDISALAHQEDPGSGFGSLIFGVVNGIITSFLGGVLGIDNPTIDTIINTFLGFLTGGSPLDSLNLFNLTSLFGVLPISHLSTDSPELLANPGFQEAISIEGAGIWNWDETKGKTTLGSAHVTAARSTRELISNTIPVSEGDTMHPTVFAQWSGLTYTGTKPIKLQMNRMLLDTVTNNYALMGSDEIAAPASPSANQLTWLELSADYTVPANTSHVALELIVENTASAGDVWFDDASVKKLGLIQIPWVSGLPDELQNLLAGIQGLLDTIFQSITNSDLVENTLNQLFAALQSIPFANVLGIGGPSNIGESILGTWNQLISGFVGVPNAIGAGLADLFGIGYDVSSWASLGRYSFDILGIRNNKPIDQGLMATSNSNFSLGRVAMQAAAPTIAVTQSVSAIGFLRMAESNDKGVISWLGYGVANITACFVNIWQMNPDTGDMTLVHRSPNIVGLLSGGTTPTWVIYDYSATMLHTNASELYGIEITIQGSGTHNVTGTTTWLPPHPSVFPKSYAATRNSGTGTPTIGTVIPNASVQYTTNIPWIEWGITAGGTAVHSDQPALINSVGTTSYPIPSWANFIDVVAVGSGGGGGPGGYLGAFAYNGGAAGSWITGTWARGTDFTTAIAVDITVSDGGAANGGNGGDTVVSVPGHTLTATGGAGMGSGSQYGQDAGSQTYRGETYVGGGPSISQGYPGALPGGGGASGSDLIGGAGGPGAIGAAWIVFRQK